MNVRSVIADTAAPSPFEKGAEQTPAAPRLLFGDVQKDGMLVNSAQVDACQGDRALAGMPGPLAALFLCQRIPLRIKTFAHWTMHRRAASLSNSTELDSTMSDILNLIETNHFKRPETIYINEVTCTAVATPQWFLELENKYGTHPITHNNILSLLICGEKAFASIASDIEQAKQSIDICCWGFDPGMELVRGDDHTWPRGVTYGDLLIAAGKRGVNVRLLIWYDTFAKGPANQYNMPGYTHGTSPWAIFMHDNYPNEISAANSVKLLNRYYSNPIALHGRRGSFSDPSRLPPATLPMVAREEYCFSWYAAAMKGSFSGIEVRTRMASTSAIKSSLAGDERGRPAGRNASGTERYLMEHGGAHHQKPILIDYAFEEGQKAVGYVMGFNSLTDYWDTESHTLDEHRREQDVSPNREFNHLKPYRDYACRIGGGGTLIAMHKNFAPAWDAAKVYKSGTIQSTVTPPTATPPAALLRPNKPSGTSAQIVRTDPEDGDHTIRDLYFKATDNATLAMGYVYLENQYLQYEEWTQRLLNTRKNVVDAWNRGRVKGGEGLGTMPVMQVFLVIPTPEREQMIPRTYDVLATLGEQGSMKGQDKMINDANARNASHRTSGATAAVSASPEATDVIEHANSIDKPNAARLKSQFGLKVCTTMLNTCDLHDADWRYREIYIHSKLLIVDDVFFTLGSANMNQRSMAVDSEINIAVTDGFLSKKLRGDVWAKLSGDLVTGGDGTPKQLTNAFKDWSELAKTNLKKKKARTHSAGDRKLTGFLVALEDERSSTERLG